MKRKRQYAPSPAEIECAKERIRIAKLASGKAKGNVIKLSRMHVYRNPFTGKAGKATPE